jgi:DNA-directed RNA polymerase subunit RPC12/RpoP
LLAPVDLVGGRGEPAVNVLDMREVPSQGRIPFAWLDKRIAVCHECGKDIRTIHLAHLYRCSRCGSESVRIIKKTRIPYRTLTQARDEGRLLVYPDNPTSTNAMALADWRNNPRAVKTNTEHQIKHKGATRSETHNQNRPAGRTAAPPQ